MKLKNSCLMQWIVIHPTTIDQMLKPAPNSHWNMGGSQGLWGLGYQLQNVSVKVNDSTLVRSLMAYHGGGNNREIGAGGGTLGWKQEFGFVREYGVGYTVHTNGEEGNSLVESVRAIFLTWLAGYGGQSYIGRNLRGP